MITLNTIVDLGHLILLYLDDMDCPEISLQTFPTEVLCHIFSYFNGKQLAVLPLVSKLFREITNVGSLWSQRCCREFGVTWNSREEIELQGQNLTFKEIYAGVLFPYGYLLGVWTRKCGHYGSLIRTKFETNAIRSYECLPPKDPMLTEPMRTKLLFSIEIKHSSDEADISRRIKIHCHKGFGDSHPCTLKKSKEDANRFEMVCLLGNDFHRHPDGLSKEFELFKSEMVDEEPNVDWLFLLKTKFNFLRQVDSIYKCTRLHLPSPMPNVPIQPGLFKGNYGFHGIELLMLEYDSDGQRAVLTKITGDPNVPAGQVSVRSDLHRPVVLTAEQQRGTVGMLQDIDLPDIEEGTAPPASQPFILPVDCFERSTTATPLTCRARYASEGQIAGHNFENAAFIPGHWIIFDENTFGHLWFALHSFSLYSREQTFAIDKCI